MGIPKENRRGLGAAMCRWLAAGAAVSAVAACADSAKGTAKETGTDATSALDTGAAGQDAAGAADAAGGSSVATGKSTGSLDVGGHKRSYVQYVAPSVDGSKKVPLVVMLHGTGGTGDKYYGLTSWASLRFGALRCSMAWSWCLAFAVCARKA